MQRLIRQKIKELENAKNAATDAANNSAYMINYFASAAKNGAKEISDKTYDYEKQISDAKDAKEKAEKATETRDESHRKKSRNI